jgi:glycosyltransferase involved in cell wall biosynthesis/SAM-dependent methyltransferase
VQADILELLPHDITRVLDVGCGDGYIANALPAHLQVVGLEISNEALRHLKRDAIIGSITALPFPDKSFDMVMANDVLEHIPPDAYQGALKELARVAAKYLMVTVPNNEQLEANLTQCAACGAIYHVNWHQRSYDIEKLRTLFDPRFRPVEIRLSGDVTLPPIDPTIALRHDLGLYLTWAGAVCPTCSSKRQVSYTEGNLFARLLDTRRSLHWFGKAHGGAQWQNRTEVIVLYADTVSPAPRGISPRHENSDSLLRIDFANPLQAAVPDFVPGVWWAKFFLPAGAVQTTAGLRGGAEDAGPLVIPVRLPVKAERGDRILIEVSGASDSDMLHVYAIDGLRGQGKRLLACSAKQTAQRFEINVMEPWWPDRFGLALELHAFGQVCLHTLRYEATASTSTATFILLQPGHNVLRWQNAGLTYSWGLLVHAKGFYPKPELPWRDQAHNRPDEVPVSLADILQTAVEQYAALQQESHELNKLAEQKEQQRAAVEQAYAALQQRHAELQQQHSLLQQQHSFLNELTEQKEQQRAAAEQAYTAAHQEYWLLHQQHSQTMGELNKRLGVKGGAKEILRSVKRRLVGPAIGVPQPVFPAPWQPLPALPKVDEKSRKVLVLSHMYPHPDQPLSGPFIHEQVKALRQYCNIDARVLIGRPYWMFHKNPVVMLRMEKYYRLFHNACQWLSLEGVPVRYVPYRIFAPFWTHGWAYRSSICRNIDRIYAEFPFDLIHAHTGYLDGSAGMALAKRYHVPLVITEHTGPFSSLLSRPIVRHWTRRSLGSAIRIITVSEQQRCDVSTLLASNRHDRFLVLPNGVDTDIFSPPARWAPDPQAPRILFVGYFVSVKNLPLLLEAFSRVVHRIPGATLKLVGKGEVEQQEVELRNSVRQLGLGHRVEFLGLQPRTAVARIMREEADVLVLSSRSESFGCVLIEALACGKPVVSTRSGGPEDIVTADFLGELCLNENPEALAAAIIKVASNIKTYSPERIRQYVEDKFSYKSLANALERLYTQMGARRTAWR